MKKKKNQWNFRYLCTFAVCVCFVPTYNWAWFWFDHKLSTPFNLKQQLSLDPRQKQAGKNNGRAVASHLSEHCASPGDNINFLTKRGAKTMSQTALFHLCWQAVSTFKLFHNFFGIFFLTDCSPWRNFSSKPVTHDLSVQQTESKTMLCSCFTL